VGRHLDGDEQVVVQEEKKIGWKHRMETAVFTAVESRVDNGAKLVHHFFIDKY
jgi:hypothetical protein